MTGREREHPRMLDNAWQGLGVPRSRHRAAWPPPQAPVLRQPARRGAKASFHSSTTVWRRGRPSVGG